MTKTRKNLPASSSTAEASPRYQTDADDYSETFGMSPWELTASEFGSKPYIDGDWERLDIILADGSIARVSRSLKINDAMKKVALI